MNEIDEKILSYLSKVGEATQQDIIKDVGLIQGTASKRINKLVEQGLIKVVRTEGRTKYYALAKPFQNTSETNEEQVIIPKEIDTITGIRAYIREILKQYNWHSTSYDLPLTALLISKYTNLRLIIFGSQYVGKTTCIKAVYPDMETNPSILTDMHRKDMYQYIDMVKDNIKIIEQQYLHDWRFEDTKYFDKFDVVPKSRIAPSEFLFRFLPLRIKMPSEFDSGFKFFTLDLKDFKLIKTIPKELKDKFIEELSKLKYFTIDVGTCRMYLEIIKEKEIANLYYVDRDGKTDPNISSRQWRIEREYNAILKSDFLTVNFKKLQDLESLWFNVIEDIGLVQSAVEILKFSYSLSKDKELAINDAFRFFANILKTFSKIRIDTFDIEILNNSQPINSFSITGDRYIITESKLELG